MTDASFTTIEGVELASVGVHDCQTGTWNCTREDIAAAVAADGDPAFRKPVVKLGHTDPRFDGEPAVGVIQNLRASPDGMTLLGDLVGVPTWLAKAMPSAYPSRSVEGIRGDVSAAGGKPYPFRLTALALLGVSPPAIESLADVRQLYGLAASSKPRAAGQVVITTPVSASRRSTTSMNDFPKPAAGASAQAWAEWAADTGRIGYDLEDSLASLLADGRATPESVIASAPARYNNQLWTETRDLRQGIAKLKAKIEARDTRDAQRVAAAAPARRPAIDPIDLALEAAYPPFPDEVAETRTMQAVRAAAAPTRTGSLPGARESLGQHYHAATGRQWTVQAAAEQADAPEPFVGSGDLPAATASGMDPQLLSKARWQDRWAITKAPTQAEAAQRLNDSIAAAKSFGDLSTAWPPTGLDDDATSYVQAYSQHLSGFRAQGSARMSG